MLYDKHLSVNRNEACAFCHMPETGFTGPVSELNRTTGSYPGSVRTRFSDRKPQSHAYAPLSPVLHYNPGQGDLVGGNFWDMRATGRRLGNPAAEQAEWPPTNPVEMVLPDIACAVYRASQRPYRALFESVWGPQAFVIAWPDDVTQVCARPGPPPEVSDGGGLLNGPKQWGNLPSLASCGEVPSIKIGEANATDPLTAEPSCKGEVKKFSAGQAWLMMLPRR